MSSTKYNWERLNGHLTVDVNGFNTRIELTERRRKTDGDKLSAKGKGKGAKVARYQAIKEGLECSYAHKIDRANNQRNTRRAKRAK